MAEYQITDAIDITDVNCPVTFVKTKVALDELDEGDILKVHMNSGEPAQTCREVLKKRVTKS